MTDLAAIADELNALGAEAREAAEAVSSNGSEPVSLADKVEAAILSTAAIRSLPPPEWLVDGYLVRNSLALLYGPSGTYKTFLGLDFALHVATGNWWNRREVTRPGRVLYVIAEGVAGIGARLDAWQTHHKVYDLDQYEPISWLPRAINLSDRVAVAALAEVAGRIQPDLIVLDTLARCTVGVEENSAREMGVVVESLDVVRRASGACVLCIHHSGKDIALGARGNSAIRGAMDTELEMSPSGDPLTLKVTKQKDALDAVPLNLTPMQVADSCVLVPSHQMAAGGGITDQVLATLDVLQSIMVPGGIPTSVWLESSALPKRTFYRHRALLEDKGFVLNVGTEKMPRYLVAGTGEGSDVDA